MSDVLGYGTPSGVSTQWPPAHIDSDGIESAPVGEPADMRKVKKGEPVPEVTEPAHPDDEF